MMAHIPFGGAMGVEPPEDMVGSLLRCAHPGMMGGEAKGCGLSTSVSQLLMLVPGKKFP